MKDDKKDSLLIYIAGKAMIADDVLQNALLKLAGDNDYIAELLINYHSSNEEVIKNFKEEQEQAY